jgi:hypothetical protein
MVNDSADEQNSLLLHDITEEGIDSVGYIILIKLLFFRIQ